MMKAYYDEMQLGRMIHSLKSSHGGQIWDIDMDSLTLGHPHVDAEGNPISKWMMKHD